MKNSVLDDYQKEFGGATSIVTSQLGPRPSVEEDFHVVLSRDVNKNIVVPIKPRKFKPKLARPLSKQTVAAPAAATLCKRQLVHAASSAPELAGSIVTASLLDTRLVKNKKMKVQILDEYQENMEELMILQLQLRI